MRLPKIALSLLLASLLLAGPGLLCAQNDEVINRHKPFSSVDYRWTASGNLRVILYLDYRPADTQLPNYIDRDSIEFLGLNASLDIDEERSPKASFMPSEQQKSYISYLIEGGRFGLNGVLKNQTWNVLRLQVRYKTRDDGFEHTFTEMPLYARVSQNAQGYIQPENTTLAIKVDRFEYDEQVELDLSATIPDYKVFDARVYQEGSNTEVARLDPEDRRNVLEGGKLKLVLAKSFEESVHPEGRYDIRIFSPMGNISIPNERIALAVRFKIKRIVEILPDGGERELPDIRSAGAESLRIKVYTTASAQRFRIPNSARLEARLVPYGKKRLGPEEQTSFFLPLDAEGTAEGFINLNRFPDGLYQLVISGQLATKGGRTLDVVNQSEYSLEKNTKNTLRSLKFTYNKDRVLVSFRLEKEVDKSLVKAEYNRSGNLLGARLDNGEYVIEQPLALADKGRYNFLDIQVSGNPIFDFSFMVVDEAEVQEAVEEAIMAQIGGLNSRKRAELLDNTSSRQQLGQNVVSSLAQLLVKDDNNPYSTQSQAFIQQLDRLVDDTLKDLAERSRKELGNDSFWDSNFGKITKAVGGLALRYLGIVIA